MEYVNKGGGSVSTLPGAQTPRYSRGSSLEQR
jgi:hypothetical protein